MARSATRTTGTASLQAIPPGGQLQPTRLGDQEHGGAVGVDLVEGKGDDFAEEGVEGEFAGEPGDDGE
jgi:hypothetical protein